MDITSIFTFVVAVLGFAFIFYKVRHLDRYRRNEDLARQFFDEHGHWPDETREEAAAERARIQAAADGHEPYAVSEPTADGRV